MYRQIYKRTRVCVHKCIYKTPHWIFTLIYTYWLNTQDKLFTDILRKITKKQKYMYIESVFTNIYSAAYYGCHLYNITKCTGYGKPKAFSGCGEQT
jgi:archaellum biogenesis protein FlaJ (TadC family)